MNHSHNTLSRALLPALPAVASVQSAPEFDMGSTVAELPAVTVNVGPIIGQRVHFELLSKEKIPAAIERYRRLTEDVLAVL